MMGPNDIRRCETILTDLINSGDLTLLKDMEPGVHWSALFKNRLYRHIRGGPRMSLDQYTTAQLLQGAETAAAHGLIPMATPLAMRQTLNDLSVELGNGDFSAADRPWWEPLPQPSDLAKIYQNILAGLNWTLRPVTSVPTLSEIPQLLPPELLTAIHTELDSSRENGILQMTRAGTGACGQISMVRNDQTIHLTGREAHLIQSCPHLAMLIQALPIEADRNLSESFSDAPRTPPQSVMLACYPAPSDGYHVHVDNPGGDRDNGRTRSLVVYLNPRELPVMGGSLEIHTTPVKVLGTAGGMANTFDSRAVPHRVAPLEPGPSRWSLAVWFNDQLVPQPVFPEPPKADLTDVLLGAPNLKSDANRVLCHCLDDQSARGQIRILKSGGPPLKIAAVTTVYRGGAMLEEWCRYHLSMGFHKLWLIFDHMDEPDETATAARIAEAFGNRVTLLSGTEIAASRASLRAAGQLQDLMKAVHVTHSAAGVSARQALNASLVLETARKEGVDWLLHLDADELFWLEGSNRGGADLQAHFQALDQADLRRVRYINHELLLPLSQSDGLTFKRNPRQAAALLGVSGWNHLKQALNCGDEQVRSWFSGYHNGKSAVAVKWASHAAGVHSWYLNPGTPPAASVFLAGPAILHLRHGSAQQFVAKYLARASAPPGDLLQLTREETHAMAHMRQAPAQEMEAHLADLYRQMNHFSAQEAALLEQADMLIRCHLPHFQEILKAQD